MTYGTIEDKESTPLQEGGYSDDAAPGTNNNRTSSVIARAVMVGTIAGALLMAGHSMMMPNRSSNVDGMVIVPSAASRLSGKAPCLVAGGTFSGTNTRDGKYGKVVAFENCYQARDNKGNDIVPWQYCWTKSYHSSLCDMLSTNAYCYLPCVPTGNWVELDPRFVNPVTDPHSCGPPCENMYQQRWVPTDDDFWFGSNFI